MPRTKDSKNRPKTNTTKDTEEDNGRQRKNNGKKGSSKNDDDEESPQYRLKDTREKKKSKSKSLSRRIFVSVFATTDEAFRKEN